MKELNAIIEYEKARREIISLGDQISQSTSTYDDIGFYAGKKCTSKEELPCFERLWSWNKENAIYIYWEKYGGYEEEAPFGPDGEDPPELCEFCKVTQKLVDERKLARKRFGIAKRKLSALARPHIIRAD